MHPRRTAPPRTAPLRTDPPRPTAAPPARRGGQAGAGAPDGVVGEIGGGDDGRGAPQALVARLRRAGARTRPAPEPLRARVAAILAAGRSEP